MRDTTSNPVCFAPLGPFVALGLANFTAGRPLTFAESAHET